MQAKPAKKGSWSPSWREARALVRQHRTRLGLGLVLVLVNRAVGMVLPASSKFLIDDVIGKGRTELLWPLALAGGAATLLQAGTGYALGQILGVAAQRAIHEMRLRVAEPSLLILDEATSSLDSESEAMIQTALARLRAKRTTFVIAHRLSTIRSADQILVLEHGKIVERGTHAELLAKAGRYKELHDRQYHFEHERFVNPGEELAPG